jgi:hypothetical protein
MNERLFEAYRGVEIYEVKVISTNGSKSVVHIDYVCTIGGHAVSDRSVYKLKLKIDAALVGVH